VPQSDGGGAGAPSCCGCDRPAERGNFAAGVRGGIASATLIAVDLIVNMSGMPGGSLFPNSLVEDWDVEDPYGEDMETYQRICEDIEARVLSLAERLRESNEG
jgi:hypothetical protein